ncbi:MAG: YdgA family protein [Campylobacteraceae bacterium]|jgi:hypothetical protein|nr:YdgA family protein [Campylobacteraceae bacterium]
MKKVVISILVLVILGGVFFISSVYYVNKKIDAFFHDNDGVLYSSAGLKWNLTNAETTFFGGKYQTKISVYGETVLTLEHEALFGTRFNAFSIGFIDTKGKVISTKKLPDLSGKEFGLKSKITLSGIKTNIFIKSDSASNYNEYSDEYENLTWKDINADFFISFQKDSLNFDAYIPFIKIDDSNGNFFIAEEQKYKNRSNKKFGLWISDSDISIEKIDANSETVQFLLSKLNFETKVRPDKDSTLRNINKISFAELKYINFYDESDLSLSDVVFNVNLENIDAESMQKMSETISNIDPTNEEQAALAYLSFFGHISNIFAKHPKIVVEELSGKYSNQSGKISGFVQYVGNSDFSNFDFVMKADFEIARGMVEQIFRDKYKNYYDYDLEGDLDTDDEVDFKDRSDINEEYEKFDIENKVYSEMEYFENNLGIKDRNGVYQGTFEYKDGGFLLNGKPYEVDTNVF